MDESRLVARGGDRYATRDGRFTVSPHPIHGGQWVRAANWRDTEFLRTDGQPVCSSLVAAQAELDRWYSARSPLGSAAQLREVAA